MVTTVEIALLILLLALLFGAYRIVRVIKPFIINAVVGILVLIVASVLGFAVQITPMAVLICAIGGLPGAILVLVLAYLEIAFHPTAVAPLLLASIA